MIPSLGPTVAALPLAPRAAAYTAAWTAHWFVVQTAVWALLKAYERLGLVKKNTRDPTLPLWRMLAEETKGYVAWAWGIGLVHAWYNPTWSSWDYTFDFPAIFWMQVPIMLVSVERMERVAGLCTSGEIGCGHWLAGRPGGRARSSCRRAAAPAHTTPSQPPLSCTRNNSKRCTTLGFFSCTGSAT